MRIGIDARFAVRNRRGIGNYTLMLIQQLAEFDKINEYVIYIDRVDDQQVLPKQANFTVKILSPSNYLLWEQIALPLAVNKDKIEVLHCTANTAPLILSSQIRLISTVHDIMYLYNSNKMPQPKSMYQKMGKLYRKIMVPASFQRVDAIITVSHYSKLDIMSYFPALPEEKIFVTYEAANEKFRSVDKDAARKRITTEMGIIGTYIFALAGADPRKNTETVIKNFIQLKAHRCIGHKLVLTGLPGWRNSKYYEIVRNAGMEDDIVFTGYISEEQLVDLYNCAEFFLYPSRYEGFGLPILEAMACGTPVITSNVTSIPEIAGDAAVLIEPTNKEQLNKAIVKMLDDGSLKNDMIKKGFEQSAKFSWRKMAIDTLAIYEGLMQERDIN